MIKAIAGSLIKEDELLILYAYIDSTNTQDEVTEYDRAFKKLFGDQVGEDGVLRKNADIRQLDIWQTLMYELDIIPLTRHNSAYSLQRHHATRLMGAELVLALQYWMCLGSDNALEPVLGDRARLVKDDGGSGADIFRAYMDDYKEKHSFDAWNVHHVIALRDKLFTLSREHDALSKRMLEEPGKFLASKIRKYLIANQGNPIVVKDITSAILPKPIA